MTKPAWLVSKAPAWGERPGRFIAIIVAPVGKVRANGCRMRLWLGRAAILAAILTISLRGRAEDGGEGGTNGDTAQGDAIEDASLDAMEPTVVACDGALCATDSGTRCSVAYDAPGSPCSGVAWVAFPAVAALAWTRRSKRGTRCP
jgi:hypothetical protein